MKMRFQKRLKTGFSLLFVLVLMLTYSVITTATPIPAADYSISPGSAVAASAASTPSPAPAKKVTYFKIKNLWLDKYLYDSGNKVMYGEFLLDSDAMKWELLDAGNGTQWIKNIATGEYLNIQNQLGYPECTNLSKSLDSTKWVLKSANDNKIRIGSAWKTTQYLHAENRLGYVQYGTIYPVWDSAKWILEKEVDYTAVPAPLRIANSLPAQTMTSERGATVPWITYEAEDGVLGGGASLLSGNRNIGDPAGEASGRKAVKLDAAGESVQWKVIKPSNALVLRVSVPDAPAGGGMDSTISIYKNGVHLQDLKVTSKYAWLYGNEDLPTNNPKDGPPRRIYDESQALLKENFAAGDTIRLQKDSGDTAAYYNIDFIELESTALLSMPANALPITDFGANGTDTTDDAAAIEKCIAAAKAQGKIVWIPEGIFYQSRTIDAQNVTIKGCGLWYSTLYGYTSRSSNSGTGFNVTGSNTKFYDFKVVGEATIRGYGGNGFSGVFGENSELHNIWVEHTTCGVWEGQDYSANLGTNLLFEGCRFRNTFADGINLCNGTQNSVIRNCSTRNTGDDGIAIWSEGVRTSRIAYNNIIENCTAQLPWRAAGIAVYGGNSNVIQNNRIIDTMTYPGITVSSYFNAMPFTGTTLIRNNDIIRSGGTFWGGQQYGAIWINPGQSDITGNLTFTGNDIYDASYYGVEIESYSNKKITGKVVFDDLDILGAGSYGFYVKSGSGGTIEIKNTRLSKIGKSPNVYNNSGGYMMIIKGSGNVGW